MKAPERKGALRRPRGLCSGRRETCAFCGGLGRLIGWPKCPACKGKGSYVVLRVKPRGRV